MGRCQWLCGSCSEAMHLYLGEKGLIHCCKLWLLLFNLL